MSASQAATSVPLTVRDCLRKLAGAQGLFSYTLDAKKCKSGNLSTSHEVTLRENEKEVCFFTKCVPENARQNSPFLPLDGFFLNEIFVYRDLSVLFEELQDSARVPERERFKFVRFYDSSSSKCLVMENMAVKGYTVPDRRKSLTFPVAKMAVERLSTYHALSIVLAKRYPNFFGEKIRDRKHLVDFVGLHETGGREEVYEVIALLKSDALKEKVGNFVEGMMNTMLRFYESDLELGVLCHGDFRGQNLMTLKLNDVLTDVMPIDYQLVHYGHPLNDLMYFIFLATDQAFRRLHLEDLKTIYYGSLKNFLEYFDVKVEDVFPEDTFQKEFNDRLLLGFIQGLRLLPLMLAANEDVPEIFGESADLNVGSNCVLSTWMNGLVEDFVEWGYL